MFPFQKHKSDNTKHKILMYDCQFFIFHSEFKTLQQTINFFYKQ